MCRAQRFPLRFRVRLEAPIDYHMTVRKQGTSTGKACFPSESGVPFMPDDHLPKYPHHELHLQSHHQVIVRWICVPNTLITYAICPDVCAAFSESIRAVDMATLLRLNSTDRTLASLPAIDHLARMHMTRLIRTPIDTVQQTQASAPRTHLTKKLENPSPPHLHYCSLITIAVIYLTRITGISTSKEPLLIHHTEIPSTDKGYNDDYA